MLKTNLQFFAESETSTTAMDIASAEDKTVDSTATDTETKQNTKDKSTSTEMLDTRAEAQKIADAMVAKKLKGMPTKEELKAYKEWQESQKSEEQKTNEKITAAEKEKLAAEADTNLLKATVACMK